LFAPLRAAVGDALYADATSALSSAQAEATEARERSLDPRKINPAGACEAARDAEVRAQRLQAELPRLASRYHDARTREAHAEWFPHYEAVKAEVITAAENFAQTYNGWLSKWSSCSRPPQNWTKELPG
jgi:hypothetical protein